MRPRTLQIHTAAICAFVLSSGAGELMPEASISDESPSAYHHPVAIRPPLLRFVLLMHTWHMSKVAIKNACFALALSLAVVTHATVREETWNSRGTGLELPQFPVTPRRGNVIHSDVEKERVPGTARGCKQKSEQTAAALQAGLRAHAGQETINRQQSGFDRIPWTDFGLRRLLYERRMTRKREPFGSLFVLSCHG